MANCHIYLSLIKYPLNLDFLQVNDRENIHLDVSEKKCLKAVFKQTIALNMTLIDFPEDMWKDTEEILTRLEKK